MVRNLIEDRRRTVQVTRHRIVEDFSIPHPDDKDLMIQFTKGEEYVTSLPYPYDKEDPDSPQQITVYGKWIVHIPCCTSLVQRLSPSIPGCCEVSEETISGVQPTGGEWPHV